MGGGGGSAEFCCAWTLWEGAGASPPAADDHPLPSRCRCAVPLPLRHQWAACHPPPVHHLNTFGVLQTRGPPSRPAASVSHIHRHGRGLTGNHRRPTTKPLMERRLPPNEHPAPSSLQRGKGGGGLHSLTALDAGRVPISYQRYLVAQNTDMDAHQPIVQRGATQTSGRDRTALHQTCHQRLPAQT